MTTDRALAPGTVKNREAQAYLYIKFMVAYGLNYLSPEISDLAMYYQFLSNTFKSPATVKNHVSGAKTWVQLHQGNIQHFVAQELGLMSKSIVERSEHVPNPAAPLSPLEEFACTLTHSTNHIQPTRPPSFSPLVPFYESLIYYPRPSHLGVEVTLSWLRISK